jgi:hypothetical protein
MSNHFCSFSHFPPVAFISTNISRSIDRVLSAFVIPSAGLLTNIVLTPCDGFRNFFYQRFACFRNKNHLALLWICILCFGIARVFIIFLVSFQYQQDLTASGLQQRRQFSDLSQNSFIFLCRVTRKLRWFRTFHIILLNILILKISQVFCKSNFRFASIVTSLSNSRNHRISIGYLPSWCRLLVLIYRNIVLASEGQRDKSLTRNHNLPHSRVGLINHLTYQRHTTVHW